MWGKLLAVALTGLTSILIVWGVTAAVFGADWGDPLGVLMMCVGATAAMCGLGAFLTSFARTPQEAFAASLIVGLMLALLGGNLLPPGRPARGAAGAQPRDTERLGAGRVRAAGPACGTRPRRWSGRSSSSASSPLVTGGLAMARVRRMVTP